MRRRGWRDPPADSSTTAPPRAGLVARTYARSPFQLSLSRFIGSMVAACAHIIIILPKTYFEPHSTHQVSINQAPPPF